MTIPEMQDVQVILRMRDFPWKIGFSTSSNCHAAIFVAAIWEENGCSTYFGGDAKTSFSSTQMIGHKWFWSENFGFVFWVLCLFYGPSFYRCKANGNAQEVEAEVTHWDLDLRPSPRCNMCAWNVFLSTPQRHFCHCRCMLVILPCCNIAPCQSDSLRADWVIRGLGSATK